jgi:hypothetical protein
MGVVDLLRFYWIAVFFGRGSVLPAARSSSHVGSGRPYYLQRCPLSRSGFAGF